MRFLRRLLALLFPGYSSTRAFPAPSSASSPRGMIASTFRAWAEARGLRVGETTGLRVFGRVAGRQVVVDPGIDREEPGFVQITVAVAFPSASARPMVVTRATRPTDFATARLHALFDADDLGLELRAVSVGPHHVRLRLAPGASPIIVEQAVQAVGDAMRIIHAAPESEPRHPCSTTVPYPS